MAQALGRVVDSSALDTCAEPRGRHAIEIPEAWIGAEILVSIPSRIVCARCDGGGCDGCSRRGGHRIQGDEHARSVRVKLPHAMDHAIVLRLVRPFGHTDGSIAQLHLETRIGPDASAGVALCVLAARDVAPPLARTYPTPNARHAAWLIAAVLALGIVMALTTMR
jgi:hypothetical protein